MGPFEWQGDNDKEEDNSEMVVATLFRLVEILELVSSGARICAQIVGS